MIKYVIYIMFGMLAMPFFTIQAEASYSSLVCKSSVKSSDRIPFTSKEVETISQTSGMDYRSICDFIKLGSHTYKLDFLKTHLLKIDGTLKNFLNSHFLFIDDKEFFRKISDYLFGTKYKDYEQVAYTLILSDLLYGYEVGDTLPLYMELFLYYSTTNSNILEEKKEIDHIIPYLYTVNKGLLKKVTFTKPQLTEYIKKVTRDLKQSVEKKKNMSKK